MATKSTLPVRCHEPVPCAVHEFLEVLSRPWTMHILWVLTTGGPTRFGVLRRRIGKISSRVLSERLRVLEQKGLIYRNYQPTILPTVTYGITKGMKDMEKILKSLDAMAAKWREEDTSAQSAADPGVRARETSGPAVGSI